MNIERYIEVSPAEVDTDNLFYSVVSKAKEKGIFDIQELRYIDLELSKMIEETARLCNKGYIKEDAARIMLTNIFMILGSRYSISDIPQIISDIKGKKLDGVWKESIKEAAYAFDRTLKNIYHLEHIRYKYPDLRLEYAVKLKGDYTFSNVFTHSFDRAIFTKAFFALSGNENYKRVSERVEILAIETDIVSAFEYCDILPIFKTRDCILNDDSIKYTASLLDAVIISMCYSAFYRCEGAFPRAEFAPEILDELVNSTEVELCDNFCSYLHMLLSKKDIKITEKNDTVGENILNVYASRICEENIELLACHLAEQVSKKRKTEKGLKNLINFN